MSIRIFGLLSLLLIFPTIWAQSIPFDAPFTHITDKDGLSNLTINAIVQDASGYIWMGTNDGLCRYDGYEFKIYRNDRNDPNSIPDNYVYALTPASDGGLWVGTNNGGVARYIPQTDNFIYYQHDPSDPASLSSNVVQCVYEDSKGGVWIGTYDGGLNKLTIKTGRIVVYKTSDAPGSISSNMVLDIIEDANGAIWIRTANDIEVFDQGAETFKGINSEPLLINNSTTYYSGSLHVDYEGFLWATQKNHLLKINTKTLEYQQLYPSLYVTDQLQLINIEPMNKDFFWVSHIYGVFLIEKNSMYPIPFYHDPNRSSSIIPGAGMSMLQDKTGSIWISHPNRGISKLNVNRKAFQHFGLNQVGGQTIKALLVDSYNNIWVSADRMLKKLTYNPVSLEYGLSEPGQYLQFLPNMANCFMESNGGDIWIGTWGDGVKIFPQGDTIGIVVLPSDGTPGTLPDGRVQAMYEDQDGNIWIGTEGGLSLYNPYTQRFRHFLNNPENANSLTPGGVQANCVIGDVQGNVWVGTWGGLTKISSKSKDKNSFEAVYEFARYQNDPENPNSLSDNRVISVFHDPNLGENIIYAGTYGGGLNKLTFDRQTDEVKVQVYSTENGLSNNVVYSMLSDKKSKLWVSTNNGLSCLNTKTNTIETYGANDGLQADQFFWGARAEGNNGELLFGGINGFNMFLSDEIVKDTTLPSIVFNDLKILNKSVPIGEDTTDVYYLDEHINSTERLVLSHRENVFTIEFSGLHYAFPEANRYKYMLDGFDEEWIEVDSRTRFATYTNMDHGNYTFKVLASNYDGAWTEEARELRIRVKPPFWKRWWFRIFIFLLIGFTAYELYRRRMEAMQRDKELLEQKLQEGEKLVAEKIKEVEQQQEEIKRRDVEGAEMRFVNKGIALFSELLTASDGDLKELSQQIINQMVKYIDGVMGVLYLLEEEGGDPHLKLSASYAADSKTVQNGRIEIGEGYVGTCFETRETIVVDNVPENYIRLESGFGSVSPKCVCIIPVRQGENIQGVMEICTLSTLEDYKVKFIEKIGENITASISVKKSTERMNHLLEQSQQQTEELKAQEEEMRQNMEEMHATQEELQRQAELSARLQKDLEYEKILFNQLLEHSPVRVNFKDTDSRFVKASKSLLAKFGLKSNEEIEGKSEADFASEEYAQQANADDKQLMKTKKSRVGIVEHEVRPDGSEIWKNVSKIPMFTDSGECLGVLSIVYDLTESKLAEIENVRLKDTVSKYKDLIESSAYFLSFNEQGEIVAVSDRLCALWSVASEQLLSKKLAAVLNVDTDQYSLPDFIARVIEEKRLTTDSYLSATDEPKAMQQVFTAIEIDRNVFEIVMVGTV